MDTVILLSLLLACAPLVSPATAHALVAVESAGNPYAIGVVGAQLQRQPRDRAEALATARALAADGLDFSVGLAQINVRNFRRLGLTLKTERPVVLVGGMRPASGMSTDGELNVVSAIRVAADPAAAGRGVLVVMNDQVLAARDVTKGATYRLGAFQARDLKAHLRASLSAYKLPRNLAVVGGSS